MSSPRPPNSVDDSEITLSLLLGILLRMQTSGGFWGFFLIKKKNTTTLTWLFPRAKASAILDLTMDSHSYIQNKSDLAVKLLSCLGKLAQ